MGREKNEVSPFLAWVDFHARSRFVRSTIPEEKRWTTRSLALISMADKWLEATDGNGATVQCEFFFLATAKLFHLIEDSILATK